MGDSESNTTINRHKSFDQTKNTQSQSIKLLAKDWSKERQEEAFGFGILSTKHQRVPRSPEVWFMNATHNSTGKELTESVVDAEGLRTGGRMRNTVRKEDGVEDGADRWFVLTSESTKSDARRWWADETNTLVDVRAQWWRLGWQMMNKQWHRSAAGWRTCWQWCLWTRSQTLIGRCGLVMWHEMRHGRWYSMLELDGWRQMLKKWWVAASRWRWLQVLDLGYIGSPSDATSWTWVSDASLTLNKKRSDPDILGSGP